MSRARRPPGRGAAIARQMGLLTELSPEGSAGDDAELEAELLALVGGRSVPGEKPEQKTPLPMEAIERMAALCMRDEEDEDGEEELEEEDDLLAELQEVLGGGEGSEAAPDAEVPEPPSEPSDVEATLVERVAMYQAAVGNAREAGDGSRLRRYERGLKTLENLLASVRKGKTIPEDEIPPPVALGKGSSAPQPPPAPPQPPLLPVVEMEPAPPSSPAHPGKDSARYSSPEMDGSCPGTAALLSAPAGSERASAEALLRRRQREYKLAALHAKQRGDLEAATKHYRLAKSFDSLLEAVAKGQLPEPSSIPPPPAQPPAEPLSPGQPQAVPETSPVAEVPSAPRDALEALQQRMERYRTAAAQAKSKGDDRKARMHERIVKQYQDAIRAHKAGKAVDFSELPVPPGFPPIQGAETPSGDRSIAGVLETAMKLVSQEDREEENGGTEEAKPSARPAQAPAASQPKPPLPPSRDSSTAAPNSAGTAKPAPKTTAKAQQQLAFLESRRKALLEAALRAKRRNDTEGAKLFLRRAKGMEPMIQASRGGFPVDITKVPEAPVNKEDFVLEPQRDARIPPEAAGRYQELVERIRQQHEMCLNYSKQFTQLGNITETTKFEDLAEDCKRNMELLKDAHARGSPLPKYHYEQRTFTVLKNFPELNSNDLALSIVKGFNLPAPAGVAPNDLDAFVRFEFPYPNAEEAQKDKTNVVKNTDSPEFREQFKLFVNRGHRALRRILHTKGIKFEVLHKGGLFKPDRLLGAAQLKLEALETVCEVREILELLDGRRPTGGKLEVVVRLREPLSAAQMEPRTERWLVVDRGAPVAKSRSRLSTGVAPAKDGNNRVPAPPSLHVLAFEREKLERKMLAYSQARRPIPAELRDQHQEVVRRSQSLRARLQSGDPPFRREYVAQLERLLLLYGESARHLGSAGSRDAAKEALYKRNLVESELQKLCR
ncbi:coiled-coil and C2 domain-containing protein 1A isoform X2 [Cuculus canorus]|uniref:coiled-coil and C2 domain-containing protein 1A isoform X2 n=1 Tax=Cuculus canorus TaxID=55661 RepID=UPI0023AA66B9|nr:coiled-coil and C2 domain-containing protein 1A isoform X2 [Cuculus canorus]